MDQVSILHGFPGSGVLAKSIQPLRAAGVSMKRPVLFALVLALGGLASRAQAIEMFTNFNNGTELGTRPLGIEIMSPVRYHAYPQGRWFHGPMGGCDNSGPVGAPPGASPAAMPAARYISSPNSREKPVVIEPNGIESTPPRGKHTNGEDWIRSSNFLPPIDSN
jgi:hypothetical protein